MGLMSSNRINVVWWLQQRASADAAAETLAGAGIAVDLEFPPLNEQEVVRMPYLRTARRHLRRADTVLSRSGWERQGGRWPLLFQGHAIYRRKGARLLVGSVAVRPERTEQVRWRDRASLPFYALRNRVARGAKVEFFGPLWVAEGVFEPHAQTRIHVRETLSVLPGGAGRAIDVGTGSGAIALALAAHWPDAQVLGTDISARAVACARANARRRGLRNTRFELRDLLAGQPARSADLVVSILPFLSRPHLLVAEHRPIRWLGPDDTISESSLDGLQHIRRLIDQAAQVLKPGGYLSLQMHSSQIEEARAYAARAYTDFSTPADFLLLARLPAR